MAKDALASSCVLRYMSSCRIFHNIHLITYKDMKNVFKQGIKLLAKIICLRISEVSHETISGVMSLKNLWSMAYTVCHAPIPITSYF